VFKINKTKLFLITLVGITIVHNWHSTSAKIPKGDRYSQVKLEKRLIDSNFVPANESFILVKKSGGRSGGGSFKSRPSRSKSTSPSRSSNQRKSTSPSYNRRDYNSPNPSYNRRKSTTPKYQRRSSPTYRNYNSRRSSGSAAVGFIFLALILIFLAGTIFVVFYILKQVFKPRSHSSSKTEREIIRERDNNRVTVSLLQVVLSKSAVEIQSKLSELSLMVDTATDAGLVELMQESALVLLRNEYHWTHVLSQSDSLDISQAEEKFDRLSFAERSKFSNESLSNVDGKIKTKESSSDDSDGFPTYLVVSLILGTANDNPLFAKIHSSESLKEVLIELSSMPEDYLMKFELLWTPQAANEYLTDEELLMEYTKVMPL